MGDAGEETDTGTGEEVDTSAPLRGIILEWLVCLSDETSGRDNEAYAVLVLPDGRIVVGGQFHTAELGDSYMVLFDEAGGVLKSFRYVGDVVPDVTSSVTTWDIVYDNIDGVFLTGDFVGDVSLATQEDSGVDLSSLGASDVLVERVSLGGGLVWVSTAGGTDGPDIGMSLDANCDGNLVVTGVFAPPAVFGAGQANETVLSLEGGQAGDEAPDNLFLAAFTPSGELVWARQDGGDSRDRGTAVSCGADGSIFVTGMFGASNGGEAIFGADQENEICLDANGLSDVFVASYNSTGILRWASAAGSSSEAELDIARDLILLSNSSVAVVGEYSGAAVFGPGEANETLLPDNGSQNGFTASYTADGVLAWSKWFGSDAMDSAVAVARNGDSILVVGLVRGKAIWGEDESRQSIVPSPEGATYVASFGLDGETEWVAGLRGTFGEYLYDDIQSYPEDLAPVGDNAIIVVGGFHGESFLGQDQDGINHYCNSEYDGAFVVKYVFE